MSLLDVLASIGTGAGAAVDASRVRDRDQVQKDALQRQIDAQQLELSRYNAKQDGYKTAYQRLMALGPASDGTTPETPAQDTGAPRGIGPDPTDDAVGIANGTVGPPGPTGPAKPIRDRVAALPELPAGTDYETVFNTTRQLQNDQDRDRTTAESHAERLSRDAETTRLRADRAKDFDASNRAAFVSAKRLGAPEAQGDYDPDVKWTDVYTRFNTERSANRSDDINSRGADTARIQATTAAAQLKLDATRLARESEADREKKAALQARGVVLQGTLPRLPQGDQQTVSKALAAVKSSNPDIDDNVAWGIVSQQFEQGLLPGQKVRVTPGNAPPAGTVPVTDPRIAAEIAKMRAGGKP